MSKKLEFRPLVLGWVMSNNRLLVAREYDSVKQNFFYRCLGGGVDFGETSEAALRREFLEEIQAEVTNIRHLGFAESLFTYNGKPGHEWIQSYQCDLVDANLYQQSEIRGIEGKTEFIARWVECDRFRYGELRLVPEVCLPYLARLERS